MTIDVGKVLARDVLDAELRDVATARRAVRGREREGLCVGLEAVHVEAELDRERVELAGAATDVEECAAGCAWLEPPARELVLPVRVDVVVAELVIRNRVVVAHPVHSARPERARSPLLIGRTGLPLIESNPAARSTTKRGRRLVSS